ncbi:hypothetical protein [Adlercreutzia sp. ZJ154]|uniref:hypothetical protein n=1 Tax=Adlercreutzia sp. ZJ154 TaxID=2709790 RepID=UPI0013EBC42D|nr:hypothetical protein [Adlercreutzia sp. ZJ154]
MRNPSVQPGQDAVHAQAQTAARQQGYGQPGHYGQSYAQQGYAQTAYNYDPRYAQYVQANYVPPATSVAVESKRKKRGVGFWIGIAIAILALVAAVFLAYMLFFAEKPSNRAGSLGQLEGKSEAEIQAELDRIVEKGMFNISIASVAQFASGTAEGDLRIENVPGNPYLMQVTITRDDTGEVIYESGILEQNYHIQKDALSVALPKGTYLCTATFHALDPNTEEEVGVAAAQIVIEILS